MRRWLDAGKRTLRQHTGAIDQHIGHKLAPSQACRQAPRCFWLGQVKRQHQSLDGVLRLQFSSQGLQLVGAARHQHQILPGASETACQFFADAR